MSYLLPDSNMVTSIQVVCVCVCVTQICVGMQALLVLHFLYTFYRLRSVVSLLWQVSVSMF